MVEPITEASLPPMPAQGPMIPRNGGTLKSTDPAELPLSVGHSCLFLDLIYLPGILETTFISLRIWPPRKTVLACRTARCGPSFLKFFSLVAHGAWGTQRRPALFFFTLADDVHRH